MPLAFLIPLLGAEGAEAFLAWLCELFAANAAAFEAQAADSAAYGMSKAWTWLLQRAMPSAYHVIPIARMRDLLQLVVRCRGELPRLLAILRNGEAAGAAAAETATAAVEAAEITIPMMSQAELAQMLSRSIPTLAGSLKTQVEQFLLRNHLIVEKTADGLFRVYRRFPGGVRKLVGERADLVMLPVQIVHRITLMLRAMGEPVL